MKSHFTLLICFFAFACTQKHIDTELEFVVPTYNPESYSIARLDEAFYRNYNFIIDTNEHIYFYQYPIKYGWCGTITHADTFKIPPLINLRTTDITEIPLTSIGEFVKLNIIRGSYLNRQVVLASRLDTIRFKEFSQLVLLLKDSNNKTEWILRKTTPEEEVVLDYKKKQSEYDSKKIRWDSSKTFFMETIEKKITKQLNEYRNRSR